MRSDQGWINISRYELRRQGRRSFPFLPGVFFIVLGIVVLTSPRLFVGVLAALFFFFGALFCYLAWRFMQFKRQLSKLTQDLEGRIQVQAFHVRPGQSETSEVDTKKIVYH